MIVCVAVETPRDLLGTIVISKCGRDKGRMCVILGWAPGDFALIADGRFRIVARPKKKNIKHLVFTKSRPMELGERILNGNQVTDRMIREELAAFGERTGERRQYGKK